MKYNTLYEYQCCSYCFKSEWTKHTECPSYCKRGYSPCVKTIAKMFERPFTRGYFHDDTPIS